MNREPWFCDGNVILACDATAMFRVHKGVMAHHSEVFRNLFADSTATTNSDGPLTVEGCPVIHLSDAPEDCQNLLLALYGPVSLKMRNVDDFLHLSSLLRLATKYCIDWLRNKAIAYLCRTWPFTLQDWISLPNDKVKPVAHPALVINLARKVDVPILLPLALYRLGRLSIHDAHEVDLNSSRGPIAKSAYVLGPQDIFNHLRYRERERESARSFVEDFLEPFTPDMSCLQDTHADGPGRCEKYFQEIACEVRGQFLTACPPISFIEIATGLLDDEYFPLCSSCRGRFVADVNGKKQELWNALPGWFGLPAWDVLIAGFVPED